MSSKKTDDKLNKLMSFGQSAGSKPAAAAVAHISAPDAAVPLPPESPVAPKSPDVPETEKTKPPVGSVRSSPRVKPPESEAKPLLIRNVGFTSEDQEHLDRISELLRQGGEFRPSISDLVRVALRGCKALGVAEAKKILDSSRKFDGRRKR